MTLYEQMARAVGNPTRAWCRHCGRSVRVNAAEACEVGWPKCCTYTMTIDHPNGWREDTLGRRRALSGEEQREKERARRAKARGES